MSNINGNPTNSTFDEIITDNINSIDNSSNIELGNNTIDLLASNVLINGAPISGGGVQNPMTSALECANNNINNVGIITGDSIDITGASAFGAPSLTITSGIFNPQLVINGGAAPTVRTNCKNVTGQLAGFASSYNSFSTLSDVGGEVQVCEIINTATQNHTATGAGNDFKIKTTLDNTILSSERLRIGGDGTTYITGNTDMYGNCRNKLGVTNSFAVTDDTIGPFQLLRFSVNNTQILSQIKHLFTQGLEPVTNLIGDIGTNVKKFNTLWIDKINGITPVGGLYSGLSDGALISGGTIGSLLPLSGLGSLLIPANGFSVGDSFHLVCAGDIPIGDKDDIITITLNQDGTLLATLSVDMEDSTNTFFELEADFQVRSIGATGQIVTNFDFTFNKQLLKDFKGSRKVQQSTIDTTSASTLSLTAQFAGQLNSTIQTRLFYLRKQY